jgi:hypothetical protein
MEIQPGLSNIDRKEMVFEYTRLRSFRGADCDTDHCLIVAKVGERLAVNKQAAHNLDVESFNIRKLSDLEVRKQKQIIQVCSFAEFK